MIEGLFRGFLAIHAGTFAAWTGEWSSIPEPLAREISDLSNQSAATTLVKFREGINRLGLAKDKEARTFFFSEYLTWDELIHCSYFSVPRFRMLVAYALAHSPGFRPSAVLMSHTDYELVARWYKEIKP